MNSAPKSPAIQPMPLASVTKSTVLVGRHVVRVSVDGTAGVEIFEVTDCRVRAVVSQAQVNDAVAAALRLGTSSQLSSDYAVVVATLKGVDLDAEDEGSFNVCPHAECLSDIGAGERHSVQCREVDDGSDPDRAYEARGDR